MSATDEWCPTLLIEVSSFEVESYVVTGAQHLGTSPSGRHLNRVQNPNRTTLFVRLDFIGCPRLLEQPFGGRRRWRGGGFVGQISQSSLL